MLPFTTHQITVLTRPAPTRDRQNNRVVDWSSAVRTPYGAMVEPLSSTETVQQNDQVISTLSCHLPPEAAVTAYDRAEVDGATYEVDGTPEIHKGPMPLLDHKVVVLKQVTG